MKKESPIGFFDSGVGGLSVYSRFKSLAPSENTIYFGDLKNLPYGNKNKNELISFAKNILDFFETKKVKAAVIACNTSSALAYESIKADYSFPIFPIIQTTAQIIAKMGYKRIGVFATVGTVNSNAYKKELIKHNSNLFVQEIACPNWVSIVEGLINKDDGVDDIKKHVTEIMKFSPEKIILGCTHYPYLINTLEKFANRNLFIDPAEIFAKYIYDNISLNDSKTNGYEEFYVSANPDKFIENARLFYTVSQQPKII